MFILPMKNILLHGCVSECFQPLMLYDATTNSIGRRFPMY
jgi:hypothetical protein